MYRPFFKHSLRCVQSIWQDVIRFYKREISLATLWEESKHHSTTAWREISKPPATPAHKLAIHHLNRGLQYYNSKNYADAARMFEEAIAADPSYGRARLYYGNAQYKLHNVGEAMNAWEAAIRVDPHSEAADKAREKLEHLRFKNQTLVNEIEDRLLKS